MPLYLGCCDNEACQLCGRRQEHYYSRMSDATGPCDSCGGPTRKLPSAARAVWLRPLVDYDSRSGETYHRDQERGFHTVACKRSFGGTDEKPVFKRITSRRDQLDYVRAEGVCDPSDFNATGEVDSAGEKLSTQGMPGSWV